MKIKIKNDRSIYLVTDKEIRIKRISELSVIEYSKIVSDQINFNLFNYIKYWTEIDLRDKELVCKVNLSDLEALIFDQDIDFQKVEVPNLIEFRGESLLTENLFDNTFESRYVYDLYRNKYTKGKITLIELISYSLAVMVERKLNKANDFDMGLIDSIFTELLSMKWNRILPLGFFLLKKSSNKKKPLTMLFKSSIIYLNRFLLAMKLRKPKTRMT